MPPAACSRCCSSMCHLCAIHGHSDLYVGQATTSTAAPPALLPLEPCCRGSMLLCPAVTRVAALLLLCAPADFGEPNRMAVRATRSMSDTAGTVNSSQQ